MSICIPKAIKVNLFLKEEELFYKALSDNNIYIVRQVLPNIDINYNNGEFVFRAILNKNLEVLKFLYENGADINAREGQFLGLAIDIGDPEIVKYFFKTKIILNSIYTNKLIAFLIENNITEVFDLFMCKGYDFYRNSFALLSYCLKVRNNEMFKHLWLLGCDIYCLDDKLLNIAIQSNNYDIVIFLSSLGLNIEREDNFAIKYSIRYNNNEIFSYLVDKVRLTQKLYLELREHAFLYGRPEIYTFLETIKDRIVV